MKKTKKRQPTADPLPRRIVPDRGSISGSGEGMSDAEALAILRKVEQHPTRKGPDIEVVVGTPEAADQIEMPIGLTGYEPSKAWMTIRKIDFPHYPVNPPRVVISKAELNSPIRSVLDRGEALRLAENALRQGENLRMRVLLDESATIDVDLSRDASDWLETTLHDLIDKTLD